MDFIEAKIYFAIFFSYSLACPSLWWLLHIQTRAHTAFQFRTHGRCVVGFARYLPTLAVEQCMFTVRRPSIPYSILFCCLRHKVYSQCFVYGPSTKCNFSDLPSSMPISHTQLPSTNAPCTPLISNVAHGVYFIFPLLFSGCRALFMAYFVLHVEIVR